MAFQWPRGAIMLFAGIPVSDHSRSPVDISIERIENSVRMANGSRRSYFIADKHSFAVSWELLPTASEKTADGFMGAASLKSFYEANTGPFNLTVRGRPTAGGAANDRIFLVTFENFSAEVVKRWQGMDLWNVSLELEEV